MLKNFFALAFIIVASVSPLAAATPGSLTVVNSIANLRLLPAAKYPNVIVTQWSAATGKGGGEFNEVATSCSTVSPTAGDDSGVYIQAAGGCYKRITNGQPYNVAWFGAVCDGNQVIDGVSSVAGGLTHTITSATAKWTTAMVGDRVVVNGAGTSGQQVDSTIVSVTPPGSLTYAATTATAGTGLTVSVYADDTTALDATWASAAAGGVAASLPTGLTCGYANPGSNVNKGWLFPAFYMNGGRLWLGQTGTAQDTGVSLEPIVNGFTIFGPGTIDGLYQTNQGFPQANAAAIEFQNGANKIIDTAVLGNLIVQNTKGSCLVYIRPKNTHISDLTVKNCGDFSYVPPSGDPETGREFGVILTDSFGGSSISGLTADTIAQSAILINSTTVVDATSQVKISNLHCVAVAYFCVDAETDNGTVEVNNATIDETGTISRSFDYGGGIFLGTANILWNNVHQLQANGNALVLESASGSNNNQKDWTITNTQLDSTLSATVPGTITVSIRNNGGPEKTHIAHTVADQLTVTLQSAPACVATNPMLFSIELEDFHVSGLYGDGTTTWGTVFQPDGAAHEFLYLKATDSNFGYTNINGATGTNQNEIFFDIPNDFTRGAITFIGGAWGSYQAGPTTITQPITSFSCPPGTT